MPWLVRRRRRRPGNTKAEAVARLEQNLRDALKKAKASSGVTVNNSHDNDSDSDWESTSDNDSYPQKGDVQPVDCKTSSRTLVVEEGRNARVQECAVESATKEGATHQIDNSSSVNSSNNNIATRSRTASNTAGKQGPSATSPFSSSNAGSKKGANDDDDATTTTTTTTTTNNDRNISSGGTISGSRSSGDATISTAPSALRDRGLGRPPNRRSNAATATTVALAAATTTTGIASSIVQRGRRGGSIVALGANARRMNMANSCNNNNNNDPLPSLNSISTERVDSDSPCYSPRSCKEFESLCDALRRNHPGVKCFSTENCDFMDVSQLGGALLDNTMVSDLYLYKNQILTSLGYDVKSTESKHFLRWLRQNPALTTVKLLRSRNGRLERDRQRKVANEARHEIAIISILQALAQNPSIRCFQSTASKCVTPLSAASAFVASTQQLRELSIIVNGKCERSQLEAAAVAFGQHATLATLKIICDNLEPFLRKWQALTSPLAHVTDLSLDFEYQPEPDVSSAELLSNLLGKMAQLQRVELNKLNLDSPCWAQIWSGLESNPSIVDLTLRVYGCTEEAATLVTESLQSSDATKQHIRKFYLADCLFRALGQSGSKTVANMLCGSLLEHLTLEFDYNNSGREYFDSLIDNASTFRLSSMVLKEADPESMPHLARFLPTARYLRHLSIQGSNHHAWYSPGGNWRSPDRELSVSSEFIKSVRRNGSLETFKISGRYGGHVNDRSLLRINTYTTRNREMHKLLQPSSMAPAEDAEHVPTEIPPALKLFPTIVVRGALPAEQMAPHAVLKGLVNAFKATGPQFDNDDPL